MGILNEFLAGTDNNSKDIIPIILILVLVLGLGKNTGFNLFNTNAAGRSSHHHKHRRNSCTSPGG